MTPKLSSLTPTDKTKMLAELDGQADLYVIVKRGLFYRPDAHGYTDRHEEAWKLPLSEAKKHEYLHGGGDERVTIKPAPHKDYFQYNTIIPLVQKLDSYTKLKVEDQIFDLKCVYDATPLQLCDALLVATGKASI